MKKDLRKELVKWLQDAHAMEQQSLAQLKAALKLAGDPQLEALYRGHIPETEDHQSLLEERLEEYGESPSRLKDLGAKTFASALGAGIALEKDTPAKLVAVAFALENFEIAMYELLRRLAGRGGDQATVEVADRILVDERQAAEKLAAGYDLALERSIREPMAAGEEVKRAT